MRSLILLWFGGLLLAFSALQAQNHNISQGQIFDGEPFLAVDPDDPRHLVVSWMGYKPLQQFVIRSEVSWDGGLNWGNRTEQGHVRPGFSSADPCLAFGPTGELYLSYIDFNTGQDSGFVILRKSSDGGQSWGSPTEVIGMHSDPNKRAIDRPWMQVDTSSGSIHQGNIYLTTMNLGIGQPVSPPYHPYLSTSTDGGASFPAFRYIDTLAWESGNLLALPMPSPAIGPNGTLQIAYPAWVLTHNPAPRYILASSSDGGNSFTYKDIFYVSQAFSDPNAKKSYLLRVNPADPDHLLFLYIGAIHGDGDVLLRESFDAGANWSGPLRINDDPIGNNRMQDMVWADFDRDGDLVVAWRDRRNGSDSTYQTASEIWAAVREQGSANFQANFPLTDQLVAYDTSLSGAGNDFLCIRMVDDTLNAVWGDPRNGKLNIWFQRMDKSGNLLSAKLLASETAPRISINPHPVQGKAQLAFALPAGKGWILEIRDLQGRVLCTQKLGEGAGKREISLDGEGLPTGTLMLLIRNEKGPWASRLFQKM